MRRTRGILFMAALWGLTWATIGVLIGLIKWYRGDLVDVLPTPLSMAIPLILAYSRWFGTAGAINGCFFAVLLSVAERKQSLATLSLARFALWGALATLVLPVVISLIFFLVMGPYEFNVSFTVERLAPIVGLGMASAATVLVLARRSGVGVRDPGA